MVWLDLGLYRVVVLFWCVLVARVFTLTLTICPVLSYASLFLSDGSFTRGAPSAVCQHPLAHSLQKSILSFPKMFTQGHLVVANLEKCICVSAVGCHESDASQLRNSLLNLAEDTRGRIAGINRITHETYARCGLDMLKHPLAMVFQEYMYQPDSAKRRQQMAIRLGYPTPSEGMTALANVLREHASALEKIGKNLVKVGGISASISALAQSALAEVDPRRRALEDMARPSAGLLIGDMAPMPALPAPEVEYGFVPALEGGATEAMECDPML
jgi:hypothetical protein